MEYHKIETLFVRDTGTHKVVPTELKNSVYGIIKEWEFTEKIDGTNTRIIWDGTTFTIGGKTDNASIPADLIKHMYEITDPTKLRSVFPDTSAVIYGEGYGAGIQKGGGNYSKSKQFIVFDVLVDNKWWLSRVNVTDVAQKLGLRVVPYLGTFSLEQAVEMVREGFNSVVAWENNEIYFPAEGVVGRTVETLFDKKGHRLIIKLKTKDF